MNTKELVVIVNGIIRPVEGKDDFFGLNMGSNGTAAEMRRKLVEVTLGLTQWEKSDGKLATGAYCISQNSYRFVNPWSGR